MVHLFEYLLKNEEDKKKYDKNEFDEYTRYVPRFEIINDSMYFKDGEVYRKVIPKNLRTDIINNFHFNDSGHASFDKTLEMISRRFFWPKMRRKIKKKSNAVFPLLNISHQPAKQNILWLKFSQLDHLKLGI